MCLDPRLGRLGLVAFPYFVLFELAGPLVELVSYLVVPAAVAAGLLSLEFLAAFAVVSFLLGLTLSIAALALEEHGFRRLRSAAFLRLLGLACLESFGFRQLVAFHRVRGTIDAARHRAEWGAMARVGIGRSAANGETQPHDDSVAAANSSAVAESTAGA
jgi:hypothetical protein